MDLQYLTMYFRFSRDRSESILSWAVVSVWEILHFGLRVRSSCIPSSSFWGRLQYVGGMWPWTTFSLLVSLGIIGLGRLRWLISCKRKKQGKGWGKEGQKVLVLTAFLVYVEGFAKGPGDAVPSPPTAGFLLHRFLRLQCRVASLTLMALQVNTRNEEIKRLKT